MSYFNKKEQVLDIKLTQYGKHSLSIGKFNPTYYRFFDDNVLYDVGYASLEEDQNEAEQRITNDTPYKTTQHNHVGIETELKRDYNSKQKPYTVAEFEKINMLSTPEREYVLNNELGTSNLGDPMAPNLKLQFLNGEVDSFSRFLTSSYQDLQIPQIDMDLVYKTQVLDLRRTNLEGTDKELASPVFDDQTFIAVRTDHILGLIIEDGAEFTKENFDIEVYEVMDVSGSTTNLEEELRQLSFARIPRPAIVNGLLLDKEEIRKPYFPLTPDHVEYFFDIFTDEQISESILCESVAKIKPQNLFSDLQINCPDLPYTNNIVDPYSSEITLQKAKICDNDGDLS